MGFRFIDVAREPAMGSNNAAVAVLLISSVGNIAKVTNISIIIA